MDQDNILPLFYITMMLANFFVMVIGILWNDYRFVGYLWTLLIIVDLVLIIMFKVIVKYQSSMNDDE